MISKFLLNKSYFRRSPKPISEKATKKPRVWDLGGSTKDVQSLERTTDKPEDIENNYTVNTQVSIKLLKVGFYENNV